MSDDADTLPMWVIYDHPRDFPHSFVVRRCDVHPGGVTHSPGCTVHPSLEAARAAIPPGLACLARSPDDDPVIVEFLAMIDEKALRRAWAKMEARIAYLERASGLFMPDEQLDGKHGDPVVKFAPHSWRGEDFLRRPFSQCSPDFLEKLAEALAYSADNPKAGQEKFVAYNRLDAARARSWARHLRAMQARVAPSPPEDLSL